MLVLTTPAPMKEDNPVTIRAYTTPDVFAELESEWNALVQNSMADTVFMRWEWQSIWWQAYQAGTLWVLTVRDESNRLVALAPWFIEQHPERGRLVRCIGSEDVTDYLDVIVHHDALPSAYDALAAYLAENRHEYDAIDLCNIPQDSPTYACFPSALEQHGFTVTMTQQEVCPIIHLAASWEDYLAQLDKKQRHELRRKLRIVEGHVQQGGRADWYTVTAQHDMEAELDQFTTLMAKSSPAKAEFLQNQQHVTFFRRMTPALFQQGLVKLHVLRINGQPAAAYFNFEHDGRVLVYNSGLDPEGFGHLSPGIVLLCYLIQDAIERGLSVFDFLRGNETYKYRMGASDTGVFNLKAQLSESE